MKKKSTQKIWDYNKRVFHGSSQWLMGKRELHHVWGRHPEPLKYCLHFFQLLTKEQHDNYKYLNELREMYQSDKLKCLANWSKEKQCEKMIFRECQICGQKVLDL